MRTLTASLQDRVEDPVTRPGLLVEISFDDPLKLSSRATLDWNGSTWIGWHIDARGIQVDARNGGFSGGLTLGNTDLTVSTLIMGEGVADRPISMWVFYGDAPSVDEGLVMYSGVCGSSRLDFSSAMVQLSIEVGGGRTTYSPREYMTKYRGFSLLPADGTLITWDGEVFELRGDK